MIPTLRPIQSLNLKLHLYLILVVNLNHQMRWNHWMNLELDLHNTKCIHLLKKKLNFLLTEHTIKKITSKMDFLTPNYYKGFYLSFFVTLFLHMSASSHFEFLALPNYPRTLKAAWELILLKIP